MTLRAAIYGASGYAGGELLRLLLGHPDAEPVAVISRSQAGQPVSAVHGHLARLTDLVFTGALSEKGGDPSRDLAQAPFGFGAPFVVSAHVWAARGRA